MTEDILVTTAEAAEQVGMTPATIDTWVRRGYLTPAGKRGRWNVFRLADVFTCEATREWKHRHS